MSLRRDALPRVQLLKQPALARFAWGIPAAGSAPPLAPGADRIYLRSQIAQFGSRRLLSGLRSAGGCALVPLFVRLGLHSGILVCPGFVVTLTHQSGDGMMLELVAS
jgi:hypothetical protein